MESMTQNQKKQILRFTEDILGKMDLSKNGAQQVIKSGHVFQTKLQSLVAELAKEKFILLKTCRLTVPANYNHQIQVQEFFKEFIAQYGEDHYDKRITDANFSKVSHQPIPGKTYLAKFWGINKDQIATSEENLAFLEDNKVLLSGIHGLSLAQQQIPEEFPIGKWTASFDKKETLPFVDGYHRVPGIHRYSDGDRYCGLSNFEDGWSDSHCLFGLCDLKS